MMADIANFVAGSGRRALSVLESFGRASLMLFGAIVTRPKPIQNFPLLVGQQTNLYKCILENGFRLTSPNGYMGLLHPEGVYDDPNGQKLRKDIYQYA